MSRTHYALALLTVLVVATGWPPCRARVNPPTYTNTSSCPRNVMISKDPRCCDLTGTLISPAPQGCADGEDDTSVTASMVSGFSNLSLASASLDQADLLVSPLGRIDVSMLGGSDDRPFPSGPTGPAGTPIFGNTGGNTGGNNSGGTGNSPGEAPRGRPATGGLTLPDGQSATSGLTSAAGGLGSDSTSGSGGLLGGLGALFGRSNRGAQGSGGGSGSGGSGQSAGAGVSGATGSTTEPLAEAPKSFLPGVVGIQYTEGGGRAGSKAGGADNETASGRTFDGMGLTIRTPAATGYSTMLGQDPDDYFSRIAPDDNLFKRVNRRYREKETDLLLKAIKPLKMIKQRS